MILRYAVVPPEHGSPEMEYDCDTQCLKTGSSKDHGNWYDSPGSACLDIEWIRIFASINLQSSRPIRYDHDKQLHHSEPAHANHDLLSPTMKTNDKSP